MESELWVCYILVFAHGPYLLDAYLGGAWDNLKRSLNWQKQSGYPLPYSKPVIHPRQIVNLKPAVIPESAVNLEPASLVDSFSYLLPIIDFGLYNQTVELEERSPEQWLLEDNVNASYLKLVQDTEKLADWILTEYYRSSAYPIPHCFPTY